MKGSRHLQELIDTENIKLSGKESLSGPAEYSKLESQLRGVIKDIAEIKRTLRVQGVYNEIADLVCDRFGFDADDKKAIEGALAQLYKYKISEDDAFSVDHLELTIQLVELTRTSVILRQRLRELRTNSQSELQDTVESTGKQNGAEETEEGSESIDEDFREDNLDEEEE
jgi:hypothetical protein